MAEVCDSPNVKQEPQSNTASENSTPTQQNISPYILNRDKAVKKIIDAANRNEHADFQFHTNQLVIHLSAAAYGTMCKAVKRHYENSQFEVLLKEKMDQEGIITEWLLSVKNPENLKESLRISMYHTTSRILVNGSMYPKFLAQHLDQIRQSLPNSDDMVTLNNDIKSKCAEFLIELKNQRKSDPKNTPLKIPECRGEDQSETVETTDSIPVPFQETPNKLSKIQETYKPVSMVTPNSKINIPVPERISTEEVLSTMESKLETPNKQPDESENGGDMTPGLKTRNETPKTTPPSAKVSPKYARGSMPPENAMVIQSNYTFLTQELSPLDLADYLYQEFIFDHETHERITTNKDGRIAGMRILLKSLLNSGKSAFTKFVEGLRVTGYDHVADILMGVESV